jgi:hypothetical protein
VKIVLTVVLACAAVYGFVHENLFAQSSWSESGRVAFLAYTGVYWAIAAALIALAPRWTAHAIVALLLLYTAWWSGPAGPLTVLYLLGAFLLTGRILARSADALTALLLGSAAWMTAIWFALHFPVNRPAVYVAALALPYIVEAPRLSAWSRLFTARPLFDRRTTGALALLLFVLSTYWMLALKPDVSSDGLSMHLALPAKVAELGSWSFDVQQFTWAVMPNAVDGLYAAVYLLGGEAAARLLNFAFLALIAALVAQAARRWVSLPVALLTAALFASTPVAGLVTGSLFVENVWTALVLSAVLAVVRYADSGQARELIVMSALAGAAVASKLIAAAFVAPLFAIALVVALPRWRPLAASALVLCALAVPPYVFAWVKTGNPIFPFSNQVFRSPYYDSTKAFEDLRYQAALSWKTPYAITFRSRGYLEAPGGGAAGFQYFVLLLPALLALTSAQNRRQKVIVLIAGVVPALVILAVLPNLRYLYAALPLLSIPLAWLLAESRIAAGLAIVLTGLNLWFLPSAGFYDQDFALFHKSDITPYFERLAPARLLIDHLNRNAPSEPVVFFGTDTIAELRAPAYSANWHNENFWRRVRELPDARAVADVFRDMGIRYVVAPMGRQSPYLGLRVFLTRWLDEEGARAGSLAVYRVRDSATPVVSDPRPLTPGAYDDSDPRIEVQGDWFNDAQFSQASGGTVTYSDAAGDLLRVRFTGNAVKYVFTKALNRGIAEVRIDGALKSRLNLYSADTVWQASAEFDRLAAGTHTLEILVTGEKDSRSSGRYVDLDALVVK